MTTAPTFSDTKADYTSLLTRVQIKPEWMGAYTRAADYIIRNRERYEQVASHVGTIPWAIIGCWHWREANGSFAGVLHNGDRIIGTGRKTYHVPAGRGPFRTWEEAAIDALKLKGLQSINYWSLERIAYESERFNGMGYRMHFPDVKSPYLWAGTNVYTKGKYTSDGKFDRRHVDQQIGVMGLYQMITDRSTVIKPNVKVTTRVNQIISWLGGAVGSLFTLDSLGTLQQVHMGLSGILTPGRVTALVIAGVAVYAGMKVIQYMEKEDVGPNQ